MSYAPISITWSVCTYLLFIIRLFLLTNAEILYSAAVTSRFILAALLWSPFTPIYIFRCATFQQCRINCRSVLTNFYKIQETCCNAIRVQNRFGQKSNTHHMGKFARQLVYKLRRQSKDDNFTSAEGVSARRHNPASTLSSRNRCAKFMSPINTILVLIVNALLSFHHISLIAYHQRTVISYTLFLITYQHYLSKHAYHLRTFVIILLSHLFA